MILGKFKGSGKLPVKHNLVYTREKDKIYTLEMYKLPCIYYVNIHDMLHDIDYSVLQEHAKVYYDEKSNEYFVKDLGSQNGTFINGSRLSEVCYDMVI